MCGEILKLQKICMFQAKIWHWHTTRRCFGKVCPLGCSKKFAFFPHSSVCAKNHKGGGRKDPISTTITLCWYFLFIFLLHEDRFFGFVLVTRWVQMDNIHRRIVSPRDQKLPAFMSSLAWGLVTAELRLNTSMSISRRWGFTSTSLQTLLRRDVRRFWIAIMSLWNKTLLLTPQSLLFKGNGVEPLLHPCLWPAMLPLQSLAATRCCY